MKSIAYKFVLLTSLLCLIAFSSNAGTIYSTLYGGLWNSELTWIGEVIPGENDTAIVQGAVIVGDVSGYEIFHSYGGWVIIEPNGGLTAHEYGGGLGTFILFVAHDIENNGTLSNGEELLMIIVSGDITNNNHWGAYKTTFSGSENHNISLAAGQVFHGYWEGISNGNITALSDLYFDGNYSVNTSAYTDGDINLNHTTLHMGNHGINTNQTLIYNGIIEGEFEILGTFEVDKDITDTLVFQGTVYITDTLLNSQYGGGYGILKLRVEGDIVNNGVVQDNPIGDDLNILISGNIINNSQWSCNFVTFIGNADQHIQGAAFESNFIDIDPTTILILDSDITCTQDIELNLSVLEGAGHTLFMTNWLKNGSINNVNLHSGYLQNIISLDNLRIEGVVICDDGNIFQNSLIVNDTLQCNQYGGGSKYFDLQIDGDVVNNGLIRDDNTYGDMLRVYLSGNVINNGQWIPDETILNGSSDQELQLSQGNYFGGNFGDQDSTSNIIAIGDLVFTGAFNLGRSILEMQHHRLSMSGWLFNGFINNTILHGGLLQNLTSMDSLTIEGTVNCDSYNVFQNSVIVNDTLQPNEYGGGTFTFVLNIEGNLTNNGVIKNRPGDFLQINISGDITNSGNWTNYLTYLNGNQDQHIYLTDSSLIEGQVQLDAVLNTVPFQWYHEGILLDSPDFNGETSQVLSWNVPVQPLWYGTFYCETGDGNSRNIMVGQTLVPAINLQATAICTNAELSWEMQNGTPDTWNVYRDEELIANVSTMFYTDDMLTPGEDYSYHITALYGMDESGPTPDETVMIEFPENSVPELFTATIDEATVNCTWSIPSGCLVPDGYNVYRNGEQINTTLITDTEYFDTPGSGNFEYYVTAVYYYGESDPSSTEMISISGVNENWVTFISLYPNPASNNLKIESDITIRSFQIYNSNGQQIVTGNIADKKFQVNVSALKPGLYVVNLQSKKGIAKTKFTIHH